MFFQTEPDRCLMFPSSSDCSIGNVSILLNIFLMFNSILPSTPWRYIMSTTSFKRVSLLCHSFMHENADPMLFQKALASITHSVGRRPPSRLSGAVVWGGFVSVVHTKPCECVRLGLETKCPRDMVQLQMRTYRTKTGHTIKGMFELFCLSH